MANHVDNKTPLKKDEIDTFLKTWITDERILDLILITLWQYPNEFPIPESNRLKKEIIDYLDEKRTLRDPNPPLEDDRGKYIAYNFIANMKATEKQKNAQKSFAFELTRHFLGFRKLFWTLPFLGGEGGDDIEPVEEDPKSIP